jgi:SAM-dependent methyltransferase
MRNSRNGLFPKPPASAQAEWWPWLMLWWLRFFWYGRLRRHIRTIGSDLALSSTVKHNLLGIQHRNPRALSLISPLAQIEDLTRDSRMLVLGPRNEWDLMLLAKEGFRNVVGADLISYSPYIMLADMHHLDACFDKASFDAVICGWTLSYSVEPKRAADQMLYVVRPGGLIAVGIEYGQDDPALDDEWEKLLGYDLHERSRLQRRINSVDEILDLFGEHVAEILWRHDAPLKRAHLPNQMVAEPSRVCVIFRKGKRDAEAR